MADMEELDVGDTIGDGWEVVSNQQNQFDPIFCRCIVRHAKTGILAHCTVLLLDEAPVYLPVLFEISAKITKELLPLDSIPKFIEYGDLSRDRRYKYICTAPVGPTLKQILERLPAEAENRFSAFTCLHIALEMLYAIKDVHNAGYLIRDMKPEVFRTCVDPSYCGRLVFDASSFWMARRWRKLDDSGPFPLRDRVNFRGSLRYSSINALNENDQTRLDDVWSWFYVVVELTNGSLPWSQLWNLSLLHGDFLKQMHDMAVLKEIYHNQRVSEWLGTEHAPKEYLEIFEHLKWSSFHEEPDYSRLAYLIKQAMGQVVRKAGMEPKLDWEPDGQYHEVLQPLMSMNT